jgi:hypothetical protein
MLETHVSEVSAGAGGAKGGGKCPSYKTMVGVKAATSAGAPRAPAGCFLDF